MKFLALLEEIDKKKFKEVGDSPEQGGYSHVVIHKSIKGPEETKYEKRVRFEDQIDEILNELMAFAVINHVNKAFRAFGYKTDLLQIPYEHDWHLNVKNGKITASLVTSGFNKAATADSFENAYERKPKDYDPSKFGTNVSKRRIHYIIADKASFLNSLIGNGDFHSGNYIVKKTKVSGYAIDFGMAFMQPFDNVHTYVKDDNSKAYRWQKYLTFWELYIEHNKSNVISILRTVIKDMKKKLYDQMMKLKIPNTNEFLERIQIAGNDNIYQLQNNFDTLEEIIKSELKKSKKEYKDAKNKK